MKMLRNLLLKIFGFMWLFMTGHTFLTRDRRDEVSYVGTEQLLNRVNGYNRYIIPEQSDFVVNFGATLLRVELDSTRNVVTANVWLTYFWKDSRLAWDPDSYGGVEMLRVPPMLFWKPDIVLYNAVDPVWVDNDVNAMVYNDGSVFWIPPAKVTADCSNDGETYICALKFGSWTYDGFMMDLDFYDGRQAMSLSDYIRRSGIEVVDVSAEKRVKFYPCCEEPYPSITFNLTLQVSA